MMMTNEKNVHVTALLFSLFVSLFFGIDAKAQAGQRIGLDDDDQIEQLLKENKIPALGIGIIRDGKLKHIKVFGELKRGEPAPFNTIFNVASLTKPIVAILTLRLVSSGKWNLDEPLDKYWVDPDIKNDPRHKKLTTRLVLSHRTGFPNWRRLTKSKKLEFAFEPGTKYQYSGEGFEYLREALEKKFKRSLEELANDFVFKPLQMRDTRFVWDAEGIESRFAIGHDAKGDAYEIHKTTKANAADDLLTTVEDYGIFLVSVMKGDGLSKSIFDEMVSHQVATKDHKYFGLGWEIYDLGNGNYALSHGGSDVGAKTLVFLLPKSGQGLIIFTNSDNGTNIYLKLIADYLKDSGKQIIDIEMKAGSGNER
jgi:CubicO group peptidase (beta-lactamase class C family)